MFKIPQPTDFPSWPYMVIEASNGLAIHHKGPPLEVGPLPSVFYFALSGKDSLNLDPFNQFPIFLGKETIRVFSFTLPGHEEETKQKHGYSLISWAHEISTGHNFISSFVDKCIENINSLIEKGYVNAHKLAAAGLSRGGFMASHMASHDKRIKNVLGFAPITQLDVLEDFKNLKELPLVKKLSLPSLIDSLSDKHLRFYIGNRDLRVHTPCCFDFIHHLTEAAYHKGHRSPPIELIISASIGHKGHGTPPSIFHDGAEWIKTRFNLS